MIWDLKKLMKRIHEKSVAKREGRRVLPKGEGGRGEGGGGRGGWSASVLLATFQQCFFLWSTSVLLATFQQCFFLWPASVLLATFQQCFFMKYFWLLFNSVFFYDPRPYFLLLFNSVFFYDPRPCFWLLFNNVFFFINSQVTYVVYSLFTGGIACVAGGFGGGFTLKNPTEIASYMQATSRTLTFASSSSRVTLINLLPPSANN